MRRSDMVKIMKEFVVDSIFNKNEYVYDTDVMSELLHVIERNGMLPPQTIPDGVIIIFNSWQAENKEQL